MSINILQCYFLDIDPVDRQAAAGYFKSLGLYFQGQDKRFWIELQHYPQILETSTNHSAFMP